MGCVTRQLRAACVTCDSASLRRCFSWLRTRPCVLLLGKSVLCGSPICTATNAHSTYVLCVCARVCVCLCVNVCVCMYVCVCVCLYIRPAHTPTHRLRSVRLITLPTYHSVPFCRVARRLSFSRRVIQRIKRNRKDSAKKTVRVQGLGTVIAPNQRSVSVVGFLFMSVCECVCVCVSVCLCVCVCVCVCVLTPAVRNKHKDAELRA
jgi:hypothetical protein